jgi:starch-binding outer membrane protein, SusD/RagB family
MKKYILLVLVTVFIGACNEDKFLKETPIDFMGADNSYSTATDFDLAINELYYLNRWEFYCNGERSAGDFLWGTDLVMNASSGSALPNLASGYGASSTPAQAHWDKLYSLIAQSNTVITRLPSSEVAAATQAVYQAKAKFFRGLAYRTLVYLYGGVPLQLEEVTTPKTNYVRTSRDAVIKLAISDVKFAAGNLPDITAVEDGQISKQAAYHLLSELYLTACRDSASNLTANYKYYADSAVQAATALLPGGASNSGLALMTQRFGTYKDSLNRDVYWDLYRKNNQNRSTNGNTEGVFVIQMETLGTVAGGTDLTSIWSSPGSFLLNRLCSPQTGLFVMYKNGTSYAPFTWPIADYTGGRGIGSCVPTHHFDKEVWGYGTSDFTKDIRNANHNFVRKFKFNTTNAATKAKIIALFGSDSIDLDKYADYKAAGWTFLTGANNNEDTFPQRYLCCYQTKCINLYSETPSALISNTTTYQITGTSGGTYQDQYMFRLAETYLLRAEAYLLLGQTDLAAADINVVRGRANASTISGSDVTLDYILDERMRELGIEEKRRLTLGRLGSAIFVDRVTKYNSYYSLGTPFTSTFTLYAIPQSAIDANKDAVLTQNPGY